MNLILERGRVVASGAGSELASSQQAKELLAISAKTLSVHYSVFIKEKPERAPAFY